MSRPHRPLALVLLFMAVLCSPAGVCVADAVVATAQAAEPAHACGKQADGTSIASGAACCAEPRNGFVNVLRFTLPKQGGQPSLMAVAEWTTRTLVTHHPALVRLAPLVLRI